jgi:tetratricopeptide (TPR) repeat protein
MSEAPAGGQDSRPEKEPVKPAAGPAGPAGPAGNEGDPGGGNGGPDHDAYDLYRRGMELLGRGSAAAAAQLLERAAAAEPQSRSVREGLARAQFDTGRYAAAAGNFRRIVEASPSDDYAQFGLGLALARTGEPGAAAEHLALAAAMAPDRRHYSEALRSVRATLRARTRAGGEDPENSERPDSDA